VADRRVPLSEWRRPTDADFAFRLRTVPGVEPPAPGTLVRLPDVTQAVLEPEDVSRFERRVRRWTGPEDLDANGNAPWARRQDRLREMRWASRIDDAAMDELLSGTVLVMRGDGRTDYVMRDHHLLDALMYERWTTGDRPTALFHADRHSDWCRDGLLAAGEADQAATWWTLCEGLKAPDGSPWLRPEDVVFTTAKAAGLEAEGTRDVGADQRTPWFVERSLLGWDRALPLALERGCDWLSLDLDLFQPSKQLAAVKGLLRSPEFATLNARARVRLFVLSPQFTAGGDRLASWTVGRRRSAGLRLLNLLRRA
jgi:hypothetical protein